MATFAYTHTTTCTNTTTNKEFYIHKFELVGDTNIFGLPTSSTKFNYVSDHPWLEDGWKVDDFSLEKIQELFEIVPKPWEKPDGTTVTVYYLKDKK